MRPFPALLVALLLVVAAVAPVTGAAQSTTPTQQSDDDALPVLVPINNTTNHLAVPGSEVAVVEYNRTGIDLGTALAVESQQRHTDHDSRTFERRFRSLDSETDKRTAIRSELDALEARQQALTRRQSQAIQAYADGRISATEFARTRASIDAEARQLETSIKRVRAIIRNDPDVTLSSGIRIRIGNAIGELKILQGPVSRYSHRAITGSTSGTVYVEASSTGYTMSTIDDGEYIRETHLDAERDPNATDQFVESDRSTVIAAAARASELYPWLYEQQGPSVNGFGNSGIYEFMADHSNGRIVTYIDGGTTNVFHEAQYRPLATVVATDTRTATDGAVRVRVNRAYETGPLLVSVSDRETGTPVNAVIKVDGRRIGTTGADGSLWTVEPRGSYDVNATTADSSGVTVSVPSR